MTSAATPKLEWPDVMDALNFARCCFEQWQRQNKLAAQQGPLLLDYYAKLIASNEQARQARQEPPVDLGVDPPEDVPANVQKDAQTCRYLRFVWREIVKHENSRVLTVWQAHSLVTEIKERMSAAKGRIERESAPTSAAIVSEPGPEEIPPGTAAPEPKRPRRAPQRPMMEILLDPKNIQWLMVFGGVVLVLGLVILLYTVGVFENKIIVASLMGAATMSLMIAGWVVIARTRFQTAGRALTLLACLIMPLNLWFYHAQGLHPLTLYERLWMAALVCCALYAAAAWVLRDPLFVWVFMAGITMTSLLILANVDGAQEFWQITHPVLLLVALGLIGIHAERAFPAANGEGFSRKRFGLPFFWSGHVLLGAGLVLLLAAQLIGYLFPTFGQFFQKVGIEAPSPITTERGLRILALLIVLTGSYAYLYSDLIVRRIGLYMYAAVFTLLWAEVLAIQLLNVQLTEELVIVVMALTALVVNIVQPMIARRTATSTDETSDSLASLSQPLMRAGQPLGLFLCAVPVVLGVWLDSQAISEGRDLGWTYVGAMLVAAISCRLGAHVYRHANPRLSMIYFFGTAAATVTGAVGLLWILGLRTWHQQAPVLMVIPILYLIASRLYRGHTAERLLTLVAHAATALMLVSSLATAFAGFLMIRGEFTNLALAVFFAEAMLFYALSAGLLGRPDFIYLATAMACGAVWQLLSYGDFADSYYTLTFAVVGLLLMIAYRFAVLEGFKLTGLARSAFHCANALLSLAFVAGALITISHLGAGHRENKGELLGMLLPLAAISLLSVALVRHSEWRRWYVVTTVAEGVLAMLVLAVFSTLTLGERLEITSLILGVGLLALGHVGWYREQDRHNDLVSFSLFLGSLLVAVPLIVAVMSYRSADKFHWPDELGMLAAGLVLLATGNMFQLKSTTLAGATLVTVYVVTLPIYLPWSQMSTAAIFMMVGGGVIFSSGILLSIYRDALLALPDRIKRREGIFRVLSWR